jgi:hypothetical protein
MDTNHSLKPVAYYPGTCARSAMMVSSEGVPGFAPFGVFGRVYWFDDVPSTRFFAPVNWFCWTSLLLPVLLLIGLLYSKMVLAAFGLLSAAWLASYLLWSFVVTRGKRSERIVVEVQNVG